MAKIKIRNFGPIKDGLQSNDGFLDIKGVTVFIGNQGSGKSTIAKLYSTLSWIEKALMRTDFTENYVMKYNRFKKHLAYQNLSNYIGDQSFVEYIGDAYTLKFENNQFQVLPHNNDKNYKFPKIMYVPAERNFVSSVERPDLVKRLPLPLYDFMNEYEKAKEHTTQSEKLPIGNVLFEYKKSNKKSFLVSDAYSIELLEASSGFQSMVPLVLVTRYLSESMKNKVSGTRKEIDRVRETVIKKIISEAIDKENFSEEVLKALMEKLSSQFRYEIFINVVEEPEQNLYPDSQRRILHELLKYKNERINNKLLITTHSPYLINYLSIAVKAHSLKDRVKSAEHKERLESIVPYSSTLDAKELVIYELDERSGTIKTLDNYEGIPSDKNFLNTSLGETNTLFDRLLDIEDEL